MKKMTLAFVTITISVFADSAYFFPEDHEISNVYKIELTDTPRDSVFNGYDTIYSVLKVNDSIVRVVHGSYNDECILSIGVVCKIDKYHLNNNKKDSSGIETSTEVIEYNGKTFLLSKKNLVTPLMLSEYYTELYEYGVGLVYYSYFFSSKNRSASKLQYLIMVKGTSYNGLEIYRNVTQNAASVSLSRKVPKHKGDNSRLYWNYNSRNVAGQICY